MTPNSNPSLMNDKPLLAIILLIKRCARLQDGKSRCRPELGRSNILTRVGQSKLVKGSRPGCISSLDATERPDDARVGTCGESGVGKRAGAERRAREAALGGVGHLVGGYLESNAVERG